MKQLQKDFIGKGQVRGFVFTQLEKSAAGYIYEVNTGDNIHFEVFKHNENTHFNCVSYPSDKGFGVWAWSYSKIEQARTKFDELELLLDIKNGL